jgi:hypothetical protein
MEVFHRSWDRVGAKSQVARGPSEHSPILPPTSRGDNGPEVTACFPREFVCLQRPRDLQFRNGGMMSSANHAMRPRYSSRLDVGAK